MTIVRNGPAANLAKTTHQVDFTTVTDKPARLGELLVDENSYLLFGL